MRSRLFLSLFCAVALLAASAVQAGTLTDATWTQVTQGFPMTRTYGQFSITGTSTGSGSISVNLTYPAFATKFFVPKGRLPGWDAPVAPKGYSQGAGWPPARAR